MKTAETIEDSGYTVLHMIKQIANVGQYECRLYIGASLTEEFPLKRILLTLVYMYVVKTIKLETLNFQFSISCLFFYSHTFLNDD